MEHRSDAARRERAAPSERSAADRGDGRCRARGEDRDRVSRYAGGGFDGAGARDARCRRAGRRSERGVPAAHAENYARWYHEPHTQPALLAEAVYGLPEFCRERIPSARLVSNPGCYPTAANLAIRPLIEAGVIDRAAGIVCDAKSGVSGAGRKPSLKTSFCEVTENFSAYSILQPPARAGSADGFGSRGARVQFHGAAAAARSRAFSKPSTSARRTAQAPPSTFSPSMRSATPASRSSASINPATCPICAPCGAPISATSA